MSLSEKIMKNWRDSDETEFLFPNDVRDAVKELKEKIQELEFDLDPKKLHWEDVNVKINEIFGEKLTE